MMNKDYLEALNYVWYNYYTEELSQDEVEQIEKHLNIVQDGLKRLETIENAKPSEALENLRQQAIAFEHSKLAIKVANGNYNTIKQALLKSQEQEKVLEIIKNKNVNVEQFMYSETIFDYNYYANKYIGGDCKLTQEEFDLLKKYYDKKENE